MFGREGLQRTSREIGVHLASYTEDPKGRHGQRQPEASGSLRILHAGVLPLKASAFQTSEATLDPTAHSIPGSSGLFFGQVRKNNPGSFISFQPLNKKSDFDRVGFETG